MSETLESMEQRLLAVERELANVRERLRMLTAGEEAPAVRMLREARVNQVALAVTAEMVFTNLGISSDPVDALATQQQMQAEGVRPEENAFSRGIIDMREE